MQELIKILTNEQGIKAVSAKELYQFLEIKSRFADWFKNRVSKYGFTENQDFVTLSKNLESGGREIDYALTLDTAKELAMVEGNEKGKQARQYFIECERIAHQKTPVVASPAELIVMLAQQNLETQQRIDNLEQQNQAQQKRIEEIEERTKTNLNYYSIVGFASANHIRIDLNTAKLFGQQAKKICKEKNFEVGSIPDPRFGRIGTYPYEVLVQVFRLPKA